MKTFRKALQVRSSPQTIASGNRRRAGTVVTGEGLEAVVVVGVADLRTRQLFFAMRPDQERDGGSRQTEVNTGEDPTEPAPTMQTAGVSDSDMVELRFRWSGRRAPHLIDLLTYVKV
jgi:hypothetical protein